MMKGCATIREASLKRWQRGGAGCLFVICALFLWAPSLFAQESYREFERGLNLSDSQRAQVEGIKRKYMGEWMALKDESLRKRLEIRELWREQPWRRGRIERLQRDLYELNAARRRLFRQYAGEVSAVFNEEQRDRFNRFMDGENRRPMNPYRYRTHER
jgi:Spy/CpxP family protein refolding chaperone